MTRRNERLRREAPPGAVELVDERLAALRRLSYADLCERFLDKTAHDETELPSGTFCLETTASWDDRPHSNLRVAVALWRLPDRPGVSTPAMADDFIVAPDGSFVGE